MEKTEELSSTFINNQHLSVNIILQKSIILNGRLKKLTPFLSQYIDSYVSKFCVKYQNRHVFIDKNGNITSSVFSRCFTLLKIDNTYQLTHSLFCSDEKINMAVKNFILKIINTNPFYCVLDNNQYIYNTNHVNSNNIEYDNKVINISNSILKLYYNNFVVSTMIHNIHKYNTRLLCLKIQQHLFDLGYFCHMIVNIDMTTNFYDYICPYLEFASKFTPVILQFNNAFDCFKNACEKSNQNKYLTNTTLINSFFDKLTEIEGLIIITTISQTESTLNTYIETKESEQQENYKSIYRKNLIF